MKIKDTPTNFRVYYTSMRDAFTQKREEAIEVKEELITKSEELHKKVASNYESYKNTYKVDLKEYEEFKLNEYFDGSFLKAAKSAYMNKKNNYELVSILFDLYSLAKTQKDIKDVQDKIDFYYKLLNVSLKDYSKILETYYTEVHKHLILKGEGYSLGGNIGWICFNRCKLINPKPMLDFVATNEKKRELIEQGKKPFNKEEYEFCKQNGLEYDGIQYKVYRNEEYVYELPLLHCHLPDGQSLKFEVADRRGPAVRGKTNDDLLRETKGDTNKICELPIDVRTKLNICIKADKMLYTNFIRNEDQKPYIDTQINR